MSWPLKWNYTQLTTNVRSRVPLASEKPHTMSTGAKGQARLISQQSDRDLHTYYAATRAMNHSFCSDAALIAMYLVPTGALKAAPLHGSLGAPLLALTATA